MKIPILQPSSRKREYDSYSDELRSQVVRGWLFSNKTHRELDEEVLGLDKNYSRGYQSMGILHFLGLKANFHGIFKETEDNVAIELLQKNKQDFSKIIAFLRYDSRTISLQELIAIESAEIVNSVKDTSDARQYRISQSNKKLKRIRVYSYTYQRNPDIVAEALFRANGICEDCNKPAPFNRASDGTPFLEVHHIKSLANGGEDTLENVLALCPNCHRKKHYGET